MLRVRDMTDLFDAAETLALTRPLRGDGLAILTNGGGPGVLATDALIALGGHLTPLSAATAERLNAVLPPTWSHGNPVDIIGDADGKRYTDALSILMQDPDCPAILVLNCPTALADPQECARAVIDALDQAKVKMGTMVPTMLTSWLGEATASKARQLFAKAKVATYETPDGAIQGYMHRVSHRHNQQLLIQVPSTQIDDFEPDTGKARAIVTAALAHGRSWLEPDEVAGILSAYGVPFAGPVLAVDADGAAEAARAIGGPIALKIRSPDITHKSDVGGVVLNLRNPDQVREEAAAMIERVKARRPEATIEGFLVQPMIRRPGAIELIIGVTTNSVFGPIVMFGHGGTAVEQLRDAALELPPLNDTLARAQMARTRVWRLLQAYRGNPAADIDGLARTLVRVAQLAADFAEITELDLNPLLADASGVIAVDARIRVAASVRTGAHRLAIMPYPKRYESIEQLPSGQRVRLRPIRPEDEQPLIDGAAHMDPRDLRMRFFTAMHGLTPQMAARLTQIDYSRELALAAISDESGEGLGVVRIFADPDNAKAEFAITVRSDCKGHGLGHMMMRRIIDIARARGIGALEGTVLRENTAMVDLCNNLGFALTAQPDDPSLWRAHLALSA